MQLKADIGVVSWDLLGFGERLRLGLNDEEQMGNFLMVQKTMFCYIVLSCN